LKLQQERQKTIAKSASTSADDSSCKVRKQPTKLVSCFECCSDYDFS
jgi:hypothetical protein